MNRDNQSNNEHPVDALLGKTLRGDVPPEADRRLLERIDTFKPVARRWRFPVAIGGAVAASLTIALVWGLMSMQAQPAHAWEQMQANLAKPTKTVSFRMTQKMVVGPDNEQRKVLNSWSSVRIKTGMGSRLDAYHRSTGGDEDRTPDMITFTRPGRYEIHINNSIQTLNGIRLYTYPPKKPTKPATFSDLDPFIKQMLVADNATLKGKEMIDGRRTLIYSLPADQMIGSTKDAKGEAEVQVWVDAEYSLPVKWQFHLWNTGEKGPWETNVTFEDYVRDEPIDDSVFDLPPETVLWDRTENWQIQLTPDGELEQPLRIRVGLEDGTVLLTEQDFDGSGDRREVKDWDKLHALTSEHRGETLQVFFNDHLVAEQEIDWPINRIQVLGMSYWLE